MQIGEGSIVSEYTNGYLFNEMNHQPDFAFSILLSKMVWEQFDIGISIGASNFRGFNQNPANIIALTQHPSLNNNEGDFRPYPIYYDSDFTHFSLFSKYNFINFKTFAKGYLLLNIYAKLGLGVILPSVEMGYKDKANYQMTKLEHPLFLKGRIPSPKKDIHMLISPAVGVNYQLSERLFLSVEPCVQILTMDYLDGIITYSSNLTNTTPISELNNYKIIATTFAAKLSLGITYFFNFDTQKENRRSQLPWYENRYRSYYSKYHKPSSKRKRQQRMPFYNDELEE